MQEEGVVLHQVEGAGLLVDLVVEEVGLVDHLGVVEEHQVEGVGRGDLLGEGEGVEDHLVTLEEGVGHQAHLPAQWPGLSNNLHHLYQ